MRPKSLLLLALALGCGLVASIGISQVMDRRNTGGPAVETAQVLVAKVDIPVGEAIKPEMVKLLAVQKELVPEDAFTKIEDVKGKRSKNKLFANDILRAAKLGEAKDAPVPEGFRVVTVRASADRGGNLLKPGDRVDVQVYIRTGAVPQITEPTLSTFLADVRVFAVDTKTEATEEEQGGGATRTVSLLVTPDQAEKVTFASQVGQVQLVMRSSLDTDTELKSNRLHIKDLLGNTDVPGDRNDKKPAETPIAVVPKIEAAPVVEKKGTDDNLANMIAAWMKPAGKNAATGVPVAKPKDHFVMNEIRGGEIVQHVFGDPTKPPESSGPLGSSDNSATPDATTAPPASAPSPPVKDNAPAAANRVAPQGPETTEIE